MSNNYTVVKFKCPLCDHTVLKHYTRVVNSAILVGITENGDESTEHCGHPEPPMSPVWGCATCDYRIPLGSDPPKFDLFEWLHSHGMLKFCDDGQADEDEKSG